MFQIPSSVVRASPFRTCPQGHDKYEAGGFGKPI